jgi:hypothetical protein
MARSFCQANFFRRPPLFSFMRPTPSIASLNALPEQQSLIFNIFNSKKQEPGTVRQNVKTGG